MNPAVMAAAKRRRNPILLRYDAGTDPRAAGVVLGSDGKWTYWDDAGVLQQPAANVPHYDARVRDSQGNWDPVWLLRGGATNLIPWAVPTNIAQITQAGGVTIDAFPLGGARLGSGVHFPGDLAATYGAGFNLSGTLQPNTTYSFGVRVVMDDGGLPNPRTGGGAGSDFQLFVNSGVSPVVQRVGTTNLYDVWGTTTTGATITNTVVQVIKQNTCSARGFRVTGFMFQTGNFPTSLILTTGAAVTAAAETAWINWPYGVFAMSVYLSAINLGTAQITGRHVVFGAETDPRWVVRPSGGLLAAARSWGDGSGSVNVVAPGTAAQIGDGFDLAASLYADSSQRIEAAVNGGATAVGVNATAARLPAAFSAPLVSINAGLNADGTLSPAGTPGFIGLRSLVIARNPQSLDWFRSVAG